MAQSSFNGLIRATPSTMTNGRPSAFPNIYRRYSMKTNIKFLVFGLLFVTVAFTSKAFVTFENTGTTNGWSTLWAEDGQGGLLETNTPTYEGSTAVRCRTVF